MDAAEAAEALATAAAFDNRTITRVAAEAWAAAMPDLTLTDTRTVIVNHYTESRDFLMPADIRNRVKALRKARHDAADKAGARLLSPPESIDPDDVTAVLHWRRTYEQGIGDGLTPAAADTRACELVQATRTPALEQGPRPVAQLVQQTAAAMRRIPTREGAR